MSPVTHRPPAAFGTSRSADLVVVPATPVAIRAVRDVLTRICTDRGMHGARRDDVLLAVTEACTSCVVGSWPPEPRSFIRPTIDVEVECDDDRMDVAVQIRGGAADVACATGPRALGARLMALLADRCTIEHPTGGTRVCLRFDLVRRTAASHIDAGEGVAVAHR